jgi:xanthine dehydrogenase YagR molybdenum-binding subunit
MDAGDAEFADGMVRAGGRAVPLREAPATRAWWPRTHRVRRPVDKKYQQSTFGAHFVEVGVDAYTGEIRVRRMLAVCAAGRILNPKTRAAR